MQSGSLHMVPAGQGHINNNCGKVLHGDLACPIKPEAEGLC
jgi:hypothetical protein